MLIDDKFDDLRGQLEELNGRIQGHSCQLLKSYLTTETQDMPFHQILSVEMRDKLRGVNEYLREFLLNESVKPQKEYAEKVVEAPAPTERGERRAETLPKEIIHEIKQRSRNEDEQKPVEALSQERVALGLPQTGASSEQLTSQRLGIGIDLGASYLVAAREAEDKRVFVKSERNAFLAVRADKTTQDLLTKLKVKYVSIDDQMFVLGNLAIDFANIFKRETRRPMQSGILNPSEAESIPIIKLLMEHILWPPREQREVCCFSIPADPLDTGQDIIYQKGIFEGILQSLNFEPVIIDKGYAVVLSELGYKDFTGIGISCGGGMVNVCAAYRTVPVASFSIARGGDWINQNAACALDLLVSEVAMIKERGISLKAPTSREEEAIAIYYRNYIRYFLEIMAKVFEKRSQTPQFDEPVDIVFAGEVSLADDFLDVVAEELQTVKFGLPLGDVKRSEDPLTSVSRGCLFHAINSGKSN